MPWMETEAGTIPEEPIGDAQYLDELAEKILHIPVMHGTDDRDYQRLREIAEEIRRQQA